MYSERPAAGLPHVIAWRSRTPPGGRTTRVLPDGCMDLIWHAGDVFIAGPDTAVQLYPERAPGPIFGLRFAAGTGPQVVGVPADELTDRQVPLDQVWSPAEARRIADSDRPGEALRAVAMARWRAPDPALVEVAARAWAGWPVDAIAGRLGLSARHLQRRVKTAFGYGPKTLTRILRMQRALALARGGTPFASVAALAGYADQAHLSRDVCALAGVPLRTLVT
ncbi:helix-turn-helix domain-containing protein [Actinoplanes sp. NPDC049265]|uniref:helix-turn-helix domain-containing protein n=1 Tax=Actinoplanes sp. NPDC049265 TaxID=3363902 RepID=UPI00371EB6AE